jgi:Phage capsid family
MRSLQELGERDHLMRGFEFARLVKCYAAERGRVPNALQLAEKSRAPARVVACLKAAVTAGSTSIGSPSAWGDELTSYRQLAEGFFTSLRSRSVFFRLLGDGAFARAPMRTTLTFAVSNASGYIVGAGKPKPLSRLDLSAANLEPIRAVAQIVVSEELLRDAGPASEAAFGRELRGAVADTVDAEFFNIIGQNITPTAATANADADLQNVLDDVNTTASGRLYWAMVPSMANRLSTMLTAGNVPMFPTMTPTGGTLAGLPALISTQVPAAAGSPVANSLWLINAEGIAADAADIEVRMSREAVVEMEDAPAGDAVMAEGLGTTSLVSLWQQNLAAILAEVRFAAFRYRSNAVAAIEGIVW